MGGGGMGSGLADAMMGLFFIAGFAVTALVVIVIGGIVSIWWPVPLWASIVAGILAGLIVTLVISWWAK